MITNLFRASPEIYLNNLDGKGGSYANGARWNPAGYPIVYLASSASTALLEMANYIPHPELVPDNYRLGRYEIPTNLIDTYDKSKLPKNWDEYPHPQSTQQIGKAWLDNSSNVALRLPSSAVPGGYDDIVIFNPCHPKAGELKFIEALPLAYSSRMFSGLSKD